MSQAGRFRLTVFEGSNTEAAAVYENELRDWGKYERLRLPGFDGSYSLSLSGLWAAFFANEQMPIEHTLTGYETIVKFGNTMQLKQDFRVTVELATPRVAT